LINIRNSLSNAKSIVLPIIGTLIIVATLIGVYAWETFGRERLTYRPVIVLKNDVLAGSVIKEDMLDVQYYEVDKIIKDAITDKNAIIGLSASHFIPRNTQLHPNYFEPIDLVLKDDQFIFKLPNDWILSVPDTLRRKDTIAIYEVNAKQIEKLYNSAAITKPVNQSADDNNASEINTLTSEQIDSVQEYLDKMLFMTTAAYVKDSNNREVVTVSPIDRYDGSGKIGSVEIIVTQKQFDILNASIQKGNKFIIMYSGGNIQ